MLISVHLPKTAGTSFSSLLSGHFGPGFRQDYGDKPLHQTAVTRKLHAWGRGFRHAGVRDITCIHGHFLPYKYRHIRRKGGTFVTWMREPVARLQSHFDYWQRNFDPATAGDIHRQFVAEQWSFERFALGRELRNLYGLFLWRFPITAFDFVGVFEYLEADLSYFASHVLPSSPRSDDSALLQPHATPAKMPTENQSRVAAPPLEPELAARIRKWHQRDVELYQAALAKRETRGQPSC